MLHVDNKPVLLCSCCLCLHPVLPCACLFAVAVTGEKQSIPDTCDTISATSLQLSQGPLSVRAANSIAAMWRASHTCPETNLSSSTLECLNRARNLCSLKCCQGTCGFHVKLVSQDGGAACQQCIPRSALASLAHVGQLPASLKLLCLTSDASVIHCHWPACEHLEPLPLQPLGTCWVRGKVAWWRYHHCSCKTRKGRLSAWQYVHFFAAPA